MKRRLLVLLLGVSVALALVLAFLYIQAPPATPVRQGQMAPDLELASAAGRLRLSSLKGFPVLLIVFDTGWPASPAYLAELEGLYRFLGPAGLAVVGIGLDQDPQTLSAFVKKAEISFLVLPDPGGRLTGAIYGVPRNRTPWVYLVSPEGRVEAVYADARRWQEGRVRDKIKEWLRPLERSAPR